MRTLKWKLLDDGSLFDMRGDPFEEKVILAKDDTKESSRARKKLARYLNELRN